MAVVSAQKGNLRDSVYYFKRIHEKIFTSDDFPALKESLHSPPRPSRQFGRDDIIMICFSYKEMLC